jgi:hypothetical protein
LSAQSGPDATHLLPATPVPIANATVSTNTGPDGASYDAALIDTGNTGNGAFNKASPTVRSDNLLRVTITLNPTPDGLQAPTLLHWKVQYDCQPIL